jgi:exodeoxyribonuclease-5
MLTLPELTESQAQAVAFLVEHLTQGDRVVALRGFAGTGKTTLIPVLQQVLEAQGIAVAIGSPTHRAAMVLKRKGIPGATTLHRLALVPYFTRDYAEASRWLGEAVECHPEMDEDPTPGVNGVPYLIHTALEKHPKYTLKQVRNHAGRYGARKALEHLGIAGHRYIRGYGPKRGHGVLILDEASMVGQQILDLCQQAFPQIVLIGDPGQLPPVKDTAVLATVPGVDLTEVHRQAADSPILHLATAARNGEPFWQHITQRDGHLEEWRSVEASAFLEAPLITWRNEARENATHAIRAALGYRREVLTIGEPLVCRSTDRKDRALGFFNNSIWRIWEVFPDEPRLVGIRADDSDEMHEVRIHLEELDGEAVPPDAIKFRFGYALTAHTAQGGEWPTVYLDKQELFAFARWCTSHDRQAELQQWSYTAITRAKATLGFLLHYRFEQSERLRAPTWTVLPREGGPMATEPVTPEPDDIPEPAVPEAVLATVIPPSHQDAPSPVWAQHEALLQGFCQLLQHRVHTILSDEHKGIMDVLGTTLEAVRKWSESFTEQNEHATYQLASTLTQLQERGLALRHDPYVATVSAVSQQGFPVRITLAKNETADLIAALPLLLAWLQEQGYKPVEPVTF